MPTTYLFALFQNLAYSLSIFLIDLKFSFISLMHLEHPLSITHIPFQYDILICSAKINILGFMYISLLESLGVRACVIGSLNLFFIRTLFAVIGFVSYFSTNVASRFILRPKGVSRDKKRLMNDFENLFFLKTIIRSDRAVTW